MRKSNFLFPSFLWSALNNKGYFNCLLLAWGGDKMSPIVKGTVYTMKFLGMVIQTKKYSGGTFKVFDVN